MPVNNSCGVVDPLLYSGHMPRSRPADAPLDPDHSPPGRWLEAVRLERPLSQAAVERLTDRIGPGRRVTQAYLSKIENGHQALEGVDPRRLEALRLALGVDRGTFEASTGVRIPAGARLPDRPADEDALVPPPAGGVTLMIRALASAGSPVTPGEENLGVFTIPESAHRAGLELYRAEGDSMTTLDPRASIDHGDVLIVDTTDLSPRDGRVYVIESPAHGVCVKRVRLLGGQVWLFSDNPAHPPFQFDSATVRGRVVSSYAVRQH